MCHDSFTVDVVVFSQYGPHRSAKMVQQFVDNHIDWHCESFAEELEIAV